MQFKELEEWVRWKQGQGKLENESMEEWRSFILGMYTVLNHVKEADARES